MRSYTYFFDAILLECLLSLLFGVILFALNDPFHMLLFQISGVSAIVVIIMAIAGIRMDLFLKRGDEDF